jgi:predicted metal-dependent phosphoesterase TrpH
MKSCSDFKLIDDFQVSPGERLEAAKRIAASGFKPDMDAVCEIDLHCHSFCSDGYFSPANKVFEAYRRKMKAIAISDHDLFDGQEEAIAAGDIFGIDVIPAIEFYTDRPGIEIIGHFPDVKIFLELLKSKAPEKLIEPIRKAKKKQLDAMIARIPGCFKKFNFTAEITDGDIDRFVRNGISTKGDISVVMWQKYGPELDRQGIAADVKDFQAKYTTKKEQIDVAMEIEMDLSPEAFVKRILDWGGLPGLPHPTELRKKEGLDNCELLKVIAKLAEAGLQTIEVDGWRNGKCPETGMNQTDLFNMMREEYNSEHPDRPPLLFTNGSDDHNQPGEGLELGCGRNRNLRPEFGKYENVKRLRGRYFTTKTPKHKDTKAESSRVRKFENA